MQGTVHKKPTHSSSSSTNDECYRCKVIVVLVEQAANPACNETKARSLTQQGMLLLYLSVLTVADKFLFTHGTLLDVSVLWVVHSVSHFEPRN
jgi:hypothetical protein